MYLVSAAEAATILTNNVSQGVSTGGSNSTAFDSPLRLTTTRVEELLEIITLSQGEFIDHFTVEQQGTSRLCLSGAFIDPDTVELRDSSGTLVAVSKQDAVHGWVQADLRRGEYTVAYEQGFAIDGDYVFQGTPEYLKSIAKYVLAIHYRLTTQASATPTTVSYAELVDATRRELNSRIQKRFHKPRYDVLLPTLTEQVDD